VCEKSLKKKNKKECPFKGDCPEGYCCASSQ